MTNSVMTSSQPSVRGLWKFLYVASFLAAIVVVGWVGFAFVQSKRYESNLSTQQQKIAALDWDIALAMQDPQYVKYAAAKQIVATQAGSAGRGDRLSRIMSVFTTLQQLWGSNVRFSDFAIDFSSLRLKGTVSDLKLMYGKGGIVDQFNALEFLKDISITDYKKAEDGYTFTLVAQVVLQNVWN